ncbi:MAG: MerR family transcriptional regulator [Propionibacteriales bacterium]|nr:MerR family transcriptional regulator [Propionibacteriales bacterium]
MAFQTDAARPADAMAIKEASELLQVPASTLRSWERRYGLPTTLRSPGGHRRYTFAALNQLRLMRDEIALGRSAADSARWVRGLLDEANPARARIDAVMEASAASNSGSILSVLDQARSDLGLGPAIDEVVLPSLRQIGTWWEAGICDVGQEHFTTEVVRGWLAKLVTLSPPPQSEEGVLLTVGPLDLHTLGLECLAAVLADQGVGFRILGSRTPQRDLTAAVDATSPVAVVVVSHLPTHRRAAVESLRAVSATGTRTFYGGNAFMFEPSRKQVPGTYLGETIEGAAQVIRATMAR